MPELTTQRLGQAEQHIFALERNPAPVAPADRAARLIDPGFGRVFTDHMAMIRYSEAKGWHDARITARGPLQMDPASSVLHYAQEIFEGMKAYHLADGGTALFRPEANARRFQNSARRMAMPELPEHLFLESVRALVKTDQDWIPSGDQGALYLRPFMFASEVFLGVKPSAEYLYLVIASAVGAYFKGGAPSVSLWVSQEYTRAAPGGTGDTKCGGNYAASLLAQSEAIRRGCDQVVFLDAVERKWIEELGGMKSSSCSRMDRWSHRRWAARSCLASRAIRSCNWRGTRALSCARSHIRSTVGGQMQPAVGLPKASPAAPLPSSRQSAASPARKVPLRSVGVGRGR